MKNTPREQIDNIKANNKDTSFYSTANAFISLIEARTNKKALKIYNKLSYGVIGNRLLYNSIYNLCLDGLSEIKITNKLSN